MIFIDYRPQLLNLLGIFFYGSEVIQIPIRSTNLMGIGMPSPEPRTWLFAFRRVRIGYIVKPSIVRILITLSVVRKEINEAKSRCTKRHA